MASRIALFALCWTSAVVYLWLFLVSVEQVRAVQEAARLPHTALSPCTQLRRYAVKKKLSSGARMSLEPAWGQKRLCGCSLRIRGSGMALAGLGALLRTAHMVDPVAALGWYPSDGLGEQLLKRLPQLAILLGIVLVMLLWRQLLLGRRRLQRVSTRLSTAQRVGLVLLGCLFTLGAVTAGLDFGRAGNAITARVTWGSAVTFMFVLFLLVVQYTARVLRVLTDGLQRSGSAQTSSRNLMALGGTKQAVAAVDDSGVCCSPAGLCYCCPARQPGRGSATLAPPRRRQQGGPPAEGPGARRRRLSLARLTNTSTLASYSNLRRVRRGVLWTCLLWAVGLLLMAPAFAVDTYFELGRAGEGSLQWESDGTTFLLYFGAFRGAEFLAIMGTLKALWLALPEDVEACCCSAVPVEAAGARSSAVRRTVANLALQAAPCVIWGWLCCYAPADEVSPVSPTSRRQKRSVARSARAVKNPLSDTMSRPPIDSGDRKGIPARRVASAPLSSAQLTQLIRAGAAKAAQRGGGGRSL